MCCQESSKPLATGQAQPLHELSDHPRYQVVRVISKGAFGWVLLANDKLAGGQVALKLLERQQVSESQAEVLIHMTLLHSHIVALHEVLLTERYLVLVLEYAAGGTLADLIPVGGLREAEARWLFQQVLFAMDYVHKMGVANRDIKLENVLLTAPVQPSCASDSSPSPGRLVKLADFGLSTSEHNCSSCSGLVGTPPYLAPEAILGQQQQHDAKSADVWSLGVLLYAMVTGSFPFLRCKDARLNRQQKMLAMLERIVAVDYVVPPGLSPACADFIACMLTSDPSQRPSVEALLHHPWCAEGLPAATVLQANDCFLARSRTNPPPQEVVDDVRSLLREARLCPAASSATYAQVAPMARSYSSDSDQACLSVAHLDMHMLSSG